MPLQTLFVLLGIVPYVFSWPYLPFVSLTMEIAAIVYSLILIAVVFWQTRSQEVLKINPLGITALVSILLVGVNILTNTHAYLRVPAIAAVFMLMIALLAMAVKRAEASGVDVVTSMAKGLFYCSWIQIIFSYLQFLEVVSRYSAWMGFSDLWIPRYPLITYATGLFFQPNQFVDFMYICLAAAILLYNQKKISKYLLMFWILSAAGVCSLAGSRSAYLYMFVFAIVGLAILWKNKNLKSRASGKLMVLSAFGMLLLQLALKPMFALMQFSVRQGLDRLSHENLFGMRMRFWQKGLMMVQDNPWFGVGWGNFGQEAMTLQKRWPFDREFVTGDFFHHSHNLFIQLLAETGVVGTLPIVIGLYFVVKSIVSGKWDEKRIFVFTAASIVFCHSQLEYPLWYSYFSLPVAALLSSQDTRWFEFSFPKKIFNVTASILIACLFIGSLLTLKWHSELVPMINSPMIKPLTEDEKNSVSTISKRPLMAEMADFVVLARIFDLSDKDLPEKLRISDLLARTRPNPYVLLRRAVYLSYNGQYTEAIECIDKAFLNSGTVNDLIKYLNEAKPDPRLNPIMQRIKELQKI